MDEEQVERVSELVVRRVFTHFMDDVLPEVLERVVGSHDRDGRAHSLQIKTAISTETTRMKLWLIGLMFIGGLGGGVGIARFITSI